MGTASRRRRLEMVRWIGAGLGVLAAQVVAASPPLYPFPQHVTLAAGTLLPNHRTQAQLDQDVRTLYDAWKARYLVQAGTELDGHPRYRVRSGRTASAATVSEGQGFGLVIVALMAGHDPDAQTVFDGLLEFSKDHPSPLDPRLSDWHVDADESPDGLGDDSAFDGDCDIAFGLLLAEAQWGNGGRFDYGAEAAAVIAGIRDSTIGPLSKLPLLGDWVDPNGTTYSQYTTRTSDFMLDNFRAFAVATGDPVWGQVIAAVQVAVTQVQSVYSPTTGLLPDFLEPVSAVDHTLRPADANFLEGPHDGQYYYNAVRDPWRLGVDAILNGDTTSRDQVRRISQWAAAMTGGNPALVLAGRRLDGTLLSGNDYLTTVFVATLGVAAMSTPGQQAWLNAVYDAVRLSDEGYYEDTVSLLCLLAMTANYWNPTLAPPPVCGNGTVEAGETCDDGDLVDGDGCDSNCTPTGCGNAVVTAGEGCDDGNLAAGDCCGATCQLEPPGSPCDDGDPCSTMDVCAAGTCAGTLAPATPCAGALAGKLTLKDETPTTRTLSWRWSKGTAGLADFGNPAGGTAGYALCVYDAAAGVPAFRLRATAPAGSPWRTTTTGYLYKNTALTPGRVKQLRLKTGAGTASIKVDAKGANLSALGLPLTHSPAVTVQLKASTGGCWETRHTAPATRNDAARFVDPAG